MIGFTKFILSAIPYMLFGGIFLLIYLGAMNLDRIAAEQMERHRNADMAQYERLMDDCGNTGKALYECAIILKSFKPEID